jgi:excisionase family DNA binding protein
VPSESELLDIKQASALLQVSEASLRRWTNAGRLASFRVGGRRERRFRRDDLLAFLDAPPARGRMSGPAVAARTAGPGHVCGVYTSEQARTRQVARFIADGLRESHHCFMAVEPEASRRILLELGRGVTTLKADLKAERLVVLRYQKTVAAQLAMLTTNFAEAMQRGARTVRMVGDVSGSMLARHSSFDELAAYETELDQWSRRHANVAIFCLYDARELTGVELAETFQAHGDTFSISVGQLALLRHFNCNPEPV